MRVHVLYIQTLTTLQIFVKIRTNFYSDDRYDAVCSHLV